MDGQQDNKFTFTEADFAKYHAAIGVVTKVFDSARVVAFAGLREVAKQQQWDEDTYRTAAHYAFSLNFGSALVGVCEGMDIDPRDVIQAILDIDDEEVEKVA